MRPAFFLSFRAGVESEFTEGLGAGGTTGFLRFSAVDVCADGFNLREPATRVKGGVLDDFVQRSKDGHPTHYHDEKADRGPTRCSYSPRSVIR